jgi:hypothetical protein
VSSTQHIAGSEKLVAALGYWPTFHDAEVISVSAQRALPVAVGGARVELVVHVRKYEVRGEGTAQYEQALVKSVLASFLCTQVADLELSEFNHQNVINSLSVRNEPSPEAAGAPLVLTIEPIWGVGGTVRCARVEVSTVQELPNAGA